MRRYRCLRMPRIWACLCRIRLLSVNGVSPTRENIENGSYPLADCFYAVTRSDADENTLALYEWICGPQGQALVEMTGYTGYVER